MAEEISKEDIQKLAQAQGLAPEAMKRLEAAKAAQEKLANEIKTQMDKLAKDSKAFKDAIVKEHKDEVVGILVLPPKPAQTKDEKTAPELLVLLEIEDGDINKLFEKKQKIIDACKKHATKLKDININYLSLPEIWDACKKGKYDILNLMMIGMPIFDRGWITAIRGVEMHKTEVIKKFEKYVICYVLAGSVLRGEAKESSDIDTFVVIDDTDVTRMTAQELKSKLTSIIWGMAAQATMATGSKYKIHTQVYLLTDMWSSIHLAHPVIFTFIREGIPLYDRGMFMPWKLLLEKGQIKSTPEAIEGYVSSGKKTIEMIKKKIEGIAVEDLFYAASIPAQGALMLIGESPPVPWKTPVMFREHFVEKRKLMTEKEMEILDKNLKLRKAFEHGKQTSVEPSVVIKNLEETEKFLGKMEKVFEALQKEIVEDEIERVYKQIHDDVSAALTLTNSKSFEKNIVAKKLAPARLLEIYNEVDELQKTKKTDREHIATLMFEEEKLAGEMFERIRAKEGSKLEKFKISIEYGDKTAGLWLLGDIAYIIKDVNDPKTAIHCYDVKNGRLTEEKKVSLDVVSEALKKFSGKPAPLSENILESIKELLGKNAKVILGL